MPEVQKGQSLNEYLETCIPTVHEEHPELSNKAVIGRCAGMYRNTKRKARKK